VHLLGAIFRAAGRRAGVIGTLTGERTTPEAPELQARLAAFRDDGATAVAMEVSSHALALHRADAVWFSVAVFTNLSHDHLDFHDTMEEYFAAKARLFDPVRAGVGVVNVDDPHGRLLLEASPVTMVPYSIEDAKDLRVGPTASTFGWRGADVRLPLGGRVNVANAVAAATAAHEVGVGALDIASGLSSADPVPGRFEAVDAGQPFAVIVDYAHTPDGLEQLLRSVRETVRGRVLVVFGAGGDRDREKRPAMGEVATRLADEAVLTSDNPRSEDPSRIIDAVRVGAGAGAGHAGVLHVEPDRRAAISYALGRAVGGDVVVIAGKGHEAEQQFADRVVAFDDRGVAREELERLGWARR
jgi:UDP-N-acetylmuramoyl-L-alanyl-D-glutamate--2,6-diaminopimelate ligase